MKKIVALLALANIGLLVWGVQGAGQSGTNEASGEVPSPALTEFDNLVVRSADVSGDNSTTPTSSSEGAPEQCRFLGPLEARELPVRVMSALDSEPTQEWVESIRAEAPLWWVHLAPATTTAEARQRLDALQERGIDSFRIDDGEFRNAISLGYFRSRDNATRLTEEYQRRDIDAQVREIPQERSIFWYRLPDSEASQPVDDAVTATDLSVQERSCAWDGSAP